MALSSDALVSDDVLGAAYERTDPRHRGWIKTTLALTEAVYAPLPSRMEERRESAASGFGQHTIGETVPWVVLLLGAGYASAPRLASAIMTARLAGVDDIIAVTLDSPQSILPEVIAALELTGVEQLFALADPMPLLAELEGCGRVLAFGVSCPVQGVPCWNDHAPRICSADLPDAAVIRWAHPDAVLVPDTSGKTGYGPDVLYDGQPGDAPLRLESGLAGCWVHQHLRPDFFVNTRLALSFLPQDSEDTRSLI